MRFLEDNKCSKAFGGQCRMAILVLGVTIAVSLTSCGGLLFPSNHGFPKKVSFSADGGVKTVKGDRDLYGVEIRTWNGSTAGCEYDGEGRGEYARKDWLTAKFNSKTGEMTITVEPNTTGKKRRLVIGGMVMDNGVDIEVHQGK